MNEDMARLARRQAWDMFFASLASMNRHPGTTRDKAERRSMADVAAEADEMLAERDRRIAEGRI